MTLFRYRHILHAPDWIDIDWHLSKEELAINLAEDWVDADCSAPSDADEDYPDDLHLKVMSVSDDIEIEMVAPNER